MTLAVRDADALVFAADMYGIQFDQLAALTGGDRSARAAAKRWRDLGYAETARLTEGPAWNSEGQFAIFSDVKNDTLYRFIWETGQVTVFRKPSFSTNGNTFDFEGRQV